MYVCAHVHVLACERVYCTHKRAYICVCTCAYVCDLYRHRCKRVYFIRHAEAHHNIAEREHELGSAYLQEQYSGWTYWDAGLTAKGVSQCAKLRHELREMVCFRLLCYASAWHAINVCMYVCVCVCVCVCTHIMYCSYGCMFVCIYVCYILVCACALVRMYLCMLCMSVCAHVIHQFVSSSMLWTRVCLYVCQICYVCMTL